MISGNASSAAMPGVTRGRSGSSTVTTPCRDWCELLPSESLSPASAAAVPM